MGRGRLLSGLNTTTSPEVDRLIPTLPTISLSIETSHKFIVVHLNDLFPRCAISAFESDRC